MRCVFIHCLYHPSSISSYVLHFTWASLPLFLSACSSSTVTPFQPLYLLLLTACCWRGCSGSGPELPGAPIHVPWRVCPRLLNDDRRTWDRCLYLKWSQYSSYHSIHSTALTAIISLFSQKFGNQCVTQYIWHDILPSLYNSDRPVSFFFIHDIANSTDSKL